MEINVVDGKQVVEFSVPGGQWKGRLTESAIGSNEFDVMINNPDPANGLDRLFTLITTAPYGQPVIDQEPTLRISLEPLGFPSYNLVGCIFVDEEKAVLRFSLSKMEFFTKPSQHVTMDREGQIMLNGEGTEFFVNTIVFADKNRIRGCAAYCTKTKPETVKELELETLALGQIKE